MHACLGIGTPSSYVYIGIYIYVMFGQVDRLNYNHAVNAAAMFFNTGLLTLLTLHHCECLGILTSWALQFKSHLASVKQQRSFSSLSSCQAGRMGWLVEQYREGCIGSIPRAPRMRTPRHHQDDSQQHV